MPPLLLAVYVPTAIFSLCDGLLVPTLPLFVASFEVSLATVGLALAGEAVGMLLADLPAGWLLGRVAPKVAMLTGGLLTACAVLLTTIAPTLALVVVLRVIAGAGLALFSLSRHAYLAHATRSADRGRAIAIYGGINRLGVFIGPAVGGALAALVGLRAPFLLYGVLILGALVLVMFFIPSEADIGTRHGRPDAPPAQRRREALRASSTTLANAGFGQILGQAVRAGRRVLIPLYAAQVLGLDVAAVGIIVSVSGLIDMLMFYPAGWLMDRRGRKHAIVPCFIVMGLGIAMVPLASGFWLLMLAGIVIGVGNGLGSGTMMTIGADLAPREAMGEFLGIWRMIGDVGMVGGPVLIGAVAQSLSLGSAATAVAGLSFGAALWFAKRVPETLERTQRPAG
ncbi:MAG TPA: MFS transporter [Trueperaceae bacterium]|nr:MFS transporter [Trueperaceae bacterium]